MTRNRCWTLARHPAGAVTADDFALIERVDDERPPEEGEIIVRNHLFSVAPTIRNRLNPPAEGLRAAIPIGGVIGGMAACEVVASAHPRHHVGSRLVILSQWEDISRLRPDRLPIPVFPVPDDMTFDDALGAYSPNTLTAYFGMIDIGRPRPGETVLVSGAAGSVGSIACQIARLSGCRVIGIAGSADKCRWLLDAGCVDAVIDYRHEDVPDRLRVLAPDGIDIFFDNVGGALLQHAIDRMARHGRIVVCGQISAYDGDGDAPGPRDMMKIVYGSIRIQGFVVGDHVDRIDAARADLRRWVNDGALTVRADRRHGLSHLPAALIDLFRGANAGALLVVNDDAPERHDVRYRPDGGEVSDA
ncbi:NADP-dependent oxidoreductase [Sphingomonadaceae bacterium OTU29LAMAA1]|nr:NADP-dependent oxidoreductase [Sphingomonadaceae bacterium OTU29LAMAA1]